VTPFLALSAFGRPLDATNQGTGTKPPQNPWASGDRHPTESGDTTRSEEGAQLCSPDASFAALRRIFEKTRRERV
jgi:hypothetical protein